MSNIINLIVWIIISYIMTIVVYRRRYQEKKKIFFTPVIVGVITWFFALNTYSAFRVGGASHEMATQGAYMSGASLILIIFGLLFSIKVIWNRFNKSKDNQIIERQQ